MTHDLTESVLREQLHAAVEDQAGSYVDVDPLAALDTGRRVLRRRRISAVAGTTAAAVALGLGSWAVLSTLGGEDRSLPAVTTAVTGESVTLELGTGTGPGREEPLSVVVTAEEAGGAVEFRLQTATGTVLDAQVRGAPPGQAPWTGLAPHVMAAVVPAGAAAFVPVWSGEVTEQQRAVEVLPDGRIAAAWRTDMPPTGTQFAGVVWTDGTSAFTATGQQLPSMVVDDLVLFANNVSGAFGYLRPEPGSPIGSGDVSQAYEMDLGQFPGVWAPDRSGRGGVYAAYLPPLVDGIEGQVTVETAPGARVRDLAIYDPEGFAPALLSAGGFPPVRFLVAHVDGPPDSVTGVRFPGSDTQRLS